MKEGKIQTLSDIYLQCFCCKHDFRKGTGHLCLCPECEDKHPLCDECYQDLKKRGKIKDTKYKQTDIDPNLKNKLI